MVQVSAKPVCRMREGLQVCTRLCIEGVSTRFTLRVQALLVHLQL